MPTSTSGGPTAPPLLRNPVLRVASGGGANAPPSIASGKSGQNSASGQTQTQAQSQHLQATLARRLLNPPGSVGLGLPPIFSDDDEGEESEESERPNESSSPPPERRKAVLDEELYEFVALALRAYVSSWWSKLAPRDKQFVPNVSLSLVHLVQALGRRIERRRPELMAFVLRDAPELLVRHYRDFRSATSKHRTSYAHGDLDLFTTFHAYQAHVGVGPDGRIERTYLRQATEIVLRATLPPADFESDLERTIVREIVVCPILSTVLQKLCEPWFLHYLILLALGEPQSAKPIPIVPRQRGPNRTFRFHTLIVLLLTVVQTTSTFCLNAINSFQQARLLLSNMNAFFAQEQHPSSSSSSESTKQEQEQRAAESAPRTQPTFTALHASDQLFELVAEMLGWRERRASRVVLSVLDLGLSSVTDFIDRLLVYTLGTRLFTIQMATFLVSLTKTITFPDGFPGPPPVVPTPVEQRVLRDKLERRIGELVPQMTHPVLLGATDAVRARTITDAFQPISTSPEINAHLIVLLLDALLIALFPALGTERPTTEAAESGAEAEADREPSSSSAARSEPPSSPGANENGRDRLSVEIGDQPEEYKTVADIASFAISG